MQRSWTRPPDERCCDCRGRCRFSTRDFDQHLQQACGGPRLIVGARVAPNCLGDPNDLEDSEDRRSAGGHGNQHVRLRGAQIAPKRSARLRQEFYREPPQAFCLRLRKARGFLPAIAPFGHISYSSLSFRKSKVHAFDPTAYFQPSERAPYCELKRSGPGAARRDRVSASTSEAG